MKSTLQSKLTAAAWAVSAFSTLAALVLFGSLLLRSHRDSIRQQLQATAASLISLGISDFSELEDFGEMNIFIEDALQMEKASRIVRIYNHKKKLVFTTVGLDYDQLPNALTVEVAKPSFLTLTGRQQKYESLVVPYRPKRGKNPFYLQVAIPLPLYSEIFGAVWWKLVLMIGGLFTLSLAFSHVLSLRLLRPVEAIARHLETMDPARVEDWKPLRLANTGTYLSAIVLGINRLAQRTRDSLLQLRKMSRYVAHELRTPLTILQGEAETVLLKPQASREEFVRILKSSLEEVQRMSETIDTVLQLGEHSRRAPSYRSTRLVLARWVEEQLPALCKTLGRPIQWRPPGLPAEATEVKTDARLLFRLLDNLVRNVRYHTPPQTPCRLFLSVTGREICLNLEDQGPSLPADKVDLMNRQDRLFETSHLGLTLCHTIAELCGFRLRFAAAAPSGGLRAELIWSVLEEGRPAL